MTNLESLTEFVDELRNSLPIPQLPQQKMVFERPTGTLYNIHKRSMPISLDKLIVLGLTRDEADIEMLRLIKKESVRRSNQLTEIGGCDNPVYFYFDIVPMECRENERGIYFNDCRVTI